MRIEDNDQVYDTETARFLAQVSNKYFNNAIDTIYFVEDMEDAENKYCYFLHRALEDDEYIIFFTRNDMQKWFCENKMMREWVFDNGCEIIEKQYDTELHKYDVYKDGFFIGTICPETVEDMASCMRILDSGDNPVDVSWDDFKGFYLPNKWIYKKDE